MFEVPRQIRPAYAGGGGGEMPAGPAPLAGLDLKRIVSIVWQGKGIILATTVAALLVAVLFVVLVPHRFTSVTQILIEPTDLRAVGNDPPANQANDTVVLQVESQVRVLTSDNVLGRVVKALGLDHDPEFAGKSSSWLGNARTEQPEVAALNALKRKITVKRAERTYVVDVGVTTRDPLLSARIANAIAASYLSEQTDVRADAARQISQSLSARLNELKDRVRQAEDRVEAFKAKNNLLGASGRLVTEQQLTELNNQLGVARARVSSAKARLDQVEHLRMSRDEIGAFPEAVQSQTITALRTQYAEVMRREAEQMTSLGERHPAVIEIEAQAARLRHMIEDEVHRIALSARADYESARANEQTLSASLEKLKSSAVTSNEAMVTLRELDRDVAASRAVYESFLVRARETGEQERIDTKNIRVISKAEPPPNRSFPPPNTLIAVAAMLIGAAAGTGLVFMRAAYEDAASRGRRTGAARRKISGFPGWFRRGAKSGIPVLAELPSVDVSYGLSEAEDPKSWFSQELGKVHEAVRASHPARGQTSMLVIAADDDDDIVAVALSLAAVAARKRRVLLIDADIERRTLSAIDADRTEAGLVDVAIGRRELSEIIVRDRESNISLLPFVSRGSRRDRPISESDLRDAFAQTGRFDLVIVASIASGLDPSTRFFADLVDQIVLVARAGGDHAADAAQFVAGLGPDGRKVCGMVLTDAEAA